MNYLHKEAAKIEYGPMHWSREFEMTSRDISIDSAVALQNNGEWKLTSSISKHWAACEMSHCFQSGTDSYLGYVRKMFINLAIQQKFIVKL